MEIKLRDNDHKRGWSNCSLDWLVMRIAHERNELKRAIDRYNSDASEENRRIIINEAADVANFAMMIADIMKADHRA